MTTIRPINNQILVRQKKAQEVSAGGIFIPTTAQEKSLEGEVLAVGPGKYLDSGELLPMTVKAGDVVLFPKHTYIEVKIDNEDYLIIREDNVLGVVER